MKNATVLDRVNVSEHRIVRAEVEINLRKERSTLIRKLTTNLTAVQNRKPKFAVSIQNRYVAFNNEEKFYH